MKAVFSRGILEVVVALTLVLGSSDGFKRKYEDRFLDYGIYTIMNRGLDKQLLTFVLPTNATDANGGGVPSAVPPEMRFVCILRKIIIIF